MSKRYKHKGNGKIYKTLNEMGFVGFNDFTMKQSSENKWERAIFYFNEETYQPFITSEKRFKERFEEINNLDDSILRGKK